MESSGAGKDSAAKSKQGGSAGGSPSDSQKSRSSKSRTNSKAIHSTDSDAVALLRPLWEGALKDLLSAKDGGEDKLVDLLGRLTTSLEDAEDSTEAVYLLSRPLPETVAIVLDTKFMTDKLHKQATAFMQAALNFCLGAAAMDTKRFSNGAFSLMAQIFRHQHFLEVMNMTAPAPQAATAENTAAASTSSAMAGKTTKGSLSFAEVVKTNAGTQSQQRLSLTASRTAKTLNRLTEAVTLFTRHNGYNVIVEALENTNSLDISTLFTILDAVIAMNQYIGVNFLRQQLPVFLKAFYPKLFRFIPFPDAATKDLFFQIRDMAMLESTQHVSNDRVLMGMTQAFIVEYTTLMLRAIDRSVSVLFIGNSSRTKTLLNIDISKMKSVKEFKSAIIQKISSSSSSSSSTSSASPQIAVATIKAGRILRVHGDDAHIFSILVDIGENVVAYELPPRGNNKQQQQENNGTVLFQVVQTKPADSHFVPFFIYAQEEKQLNAKSLYESVAGAYLFSSSKPTEQPFKLRLVTSQGGSGVDLSMSSSKAFGNLPFLTPAAQSSLTAGATIEVEWGDDVTFEELQGYDKVQFYATQNSITWAIEEFKRFGIAGPSSLADFLCNTPASSTETFKLIQKFVSAVYEVLCNAVDKVSLRLAAQVVAGLCKSGNHVMKSQIILPLSSTLHARFTVLMESTDPELRSASATALCELSAIQSRTIDLLPFPRSSGTVDDDADTTPASGLSSSKASTPLHSGLQFLIKLNLFRTVDLSYIATADPKTELYWYLPLILKMIKQEPSHTPRSSIAALMKTLQRRQFLAQLAMWLRITKFIGDDDLPGGIDWAYSQRFSESREFFSKIGASMPEKGTSWNNLNILDPIFEHADGSCRVISSVTVKKIFSSKAKPLLLEVTYKKEENTNQKISKNNDELEVSSSSSSKKAKRSKSKSTTTTASPPTAATPETSLFIFKKGDDLRVDMLVQTMFYIFNTIWANSGLKHVPFTHQYKIIPMGPDIGAVEFVTGSESIQTFDWNSWRNLTQEQRLLFIRSAAGGYVAGWVLGIRDRHQDNMMVRHGHIFYQIDFGHMFNEKPTIDAPRFAIPGDMKMVMTTEEWELFKDVCADAFRALHRMSNVIISLCLSIYEGVEDVDIAKVRKFLTSDQGLMVAMSEPEALARIKNLVESGVSSLWRMNKWGIHTMFAAGGTKAPPVSPPVSRSN